MSRFRDLALAYRLPNAPVLPLATDHDAGEAEAMAEHYATPAGPPLSARDPLRDGLLAGYRQHVARPIAQAAPAVVLEPNRPTAGDIQ